MWQHIDRVLGRGAYPALRRWIVPEREAIQDLYPRLVLDALETHPRWLDAGCGHNLFEARFARYESAAIRHTSFIVGCDATFESLRHHRTVDRLATAKLGCLPFRDGSFDLVTLHWVVEHLDDPEAVFREIARVLAPGGLVILRTPNAASYYVLLMRLGMPLIPKRLLYRLIRYMQHRGPEDVFPTCYRANSRRALTRIARQVGLVEQSILVFPDQPLFYCVAPLALLEMSLTKAAMAVGLGSLCCDTIVAVLRRPGGAVDPVAHYPVIGAGTSR
jgi:SAM-dependent methyltransferase